MNHCECLDYLLQAIPSLSFGNILFQEAEGDNCAVISMQDITAADLASYGTALNDAGFVRTDTHSFGDALFTTFIKEELVLFLSYYPSIHHLRIVGEWNSPYLRLQPTKRPKTGAPSLLTQLELKDFGMSYLIRLNDGSFLVFDGGWDFEPDADNLMEELYRQSPDEVPRIAAWIFTHPHIDHYRCFLVFSQKYAGQFVVERFLYNFPPMTEDIGEKMGDLDKEKPHIRQLETIITGLGTPVYRPHTGQIYEFANARLEILSSPDDTLHYPTDGNTISLVTRITIDGQILLFCGDADLKPAMLAERYGSYLKADILQVTHHGFQGGTVECHKLINPAVCLVPCFENDFYHYIDVYFEWIQTLLNDLDVQEMLTGGDSTSPNITLTLPYTPKPHGRQLYRDKLQNSRKELGATSWFFADMTAADAQFSLLNLANRKPNVYASLYFDETKDLVRYIKIPVKTYAVTKFNFATGEGIEDDALYFNRRSLAKIGLPTDKSFTVHIHSDQPVVVWCGKEPVYHS